MKLHTWLAGAALAAGPHLHTGNAAETIRFAVTDVEGMEQLQREYGGFVEEFEKAPATRSSSRPSTTAPPPSRRCAPSRSTSC